MLGWTTGEIVRDLSTFHYGSIKIRLTGMNQHVGNLSTFHYGSIKISFVKRV